MLANAIITRINNHFDDSNDQAYSLEEKLEWINSAQIDLALRLPIDKLAVLTKEILLTNAASYTDRCEYPLPDNYFRYISLRVSWVEDNQTYNKEAYRAYIENRRLINQNLNLMANKYSPVAIVKGTHNIEIFPNALTYGGESYLLYIKSPEVVGINNTIELWEYQESIFNYCLSCAYAKDRQPESHTYSTLYFASLFNKTG